MNDNAGSNRSLNNMLRPFQQFARTEAFSGILLLFFTVIALLWANSPLSAAYVDLWHTNITFGAGNFSISEPLHFWINDGLMAVFFFVVGLEIKREVMAGELSTPRQAALPIIAAAGGMIFPAIIFSLANFGKPGISGWGIPTATDIAFALGIMALVGKNVSLGLKVFLAALAIADDMGAVIIIAIFYTTELSLIWLGIGILFFGLQLLTNYLGVRKIIIYAILGLGLWFSFWKAGIHPTIAGVLSAIVIPARTKIEEKEFISSTKTYLHEFETAPKTLDNSLITKEEQEAIQAIKTTCEKAETPLQNLEHRLHLWVTYFIMPLFALSNAGVVLGSNFSEAYSSPVTIGVILGLIFGKPIGITLFSYIAVKSRLALLPEEASWKKILGTGAVAGIGFTMSIFIANLAFGEGLLLNYAKIGILSASIVSGLAGWMILRSSR